MQYLFDGDSKVYDLAEDKFKMSITYLELN